jgi:CPA2 family monovalent cation:H+ antiporter-2
MHNLDLIVTLTGGLGAALVFGYLTHRLGLSPIVGYLVAGIVVGPHTPGFTANRQLAEQMAEVGVILLMFGVGLKIHVSELLAVKALAVPGAIVQCVTSAVLGTIAASAFGWSNEATIIFGLSVSVASTVVLTRVLADHNDLHTPVGHAAIGWLVVQDILALLILVLLPELTGGGNADIQRLPTIIGVTCLKVALLFAVVLIAGGRVIPWLLQRIAETRSRELFTLTTLVVALGIAVGSAEVFGVSMALGAFLAGLVVGRSEFSVRAATDALPMRDAFAVLFFVSVGMLFDPEILSTAPGLVAGALAVVLVGTPLSVLLTMFALRYPIQIALPLALSLTQIGEFSFIIAALGKSLGILPPEATQALVIVAIITISVNPILYRLSDVLIGIVKRAPRFWRWLEQRTARRLVEGTSNAPDVPPHFRAVVVGYGPVGRMVHRLLRENGIHPTIIELNIKVVQELRAAGEAAVYGDANHSATLEEAGIADSGSLVLSSSSIKGSDEIIRRAKELNPSIRVLARTAYIQELQAMRSAGADAAFAGEGEVALALTEEILHQLGASGEQIDRQRARVRSELLAPATGEAQSAS